MSHTIGFKVKVTRQGTVSYETDTGGSHLFESRFRAYRRAFQMRGIFDGMDDGAVRSVRVVRVVTKRSPCGIACQSMTDPKSIAYRAFQKP